MGLIIISGVLMVLFIALCFIIDIDDNFGVHTLSCIIAFFSAATFIASLCCTINLQREFDKQIANYNSLKEIIECSRSEMSEFERVQLIQQIQENNRAINEHRYFHDNFWTGIYYSKEIGDLEYLK